MDQPAEAYEGRLHEAVSQLEQSVLAAEFQVDHLVAQPTPLLRRMDGSDVEKIVENPSPRVCSVRVGAIYSLNAQVRAMTEKLIDLQDRLEV